RTRGSCREGGYPFQYLGQSIDVSVMQSPATPGSTAHSRLLHVNKSLKRFGDRAGAVTRIDGLIIGGGWGTRCSGGTRPSLSYVEFLVVVSALTDIAHDGVLLAKVTPSRLGSDCVSAWPTAMRMEPAACLKCSVELASRQGVMVKKLSHREFQP